MTTLRLQTPTKPPSVTEATKRTEVARPADAERQAREKAERQDRHLQQTRREMAAAQQRRVARRVADLAVLREHFPAVFAKPPRPLALRISHAIRQRLGDEISALRLSAALHWWTGRDSDVQILAQGDDRHDLDGQATEAVSEAHRAAAAAMLQRRRPRRAGPGTRSQPVPRSQRSVTQDARAPAATPDTLETDPLLPDVALMETPWLDGDQDISGRQRWLASEVLYEQAKALRDLAGRGG